MRKFIGDRAFYKMVLALLIPMVITSGVSTFVNLLDNIMIGQLGTLSMSGVSIANQIIQVFNVTVFGALSGPSIFGAQFAGKKDQKGMQDCFHYKLYVGTLITVIGILIFIFFGKNLISLYLNTTDDPADVAKTLNYGMTYLKVMLIGLPAFVLSQIYFTASREIGDTVLPMVSSTIAVGVNFVFNYLLIFGKFGFPELGVTGAAIATVISRYVELGVISIYTHITVDKHIYIEKIYTFFSIKLDLAEEMFRKSIPLLANEILWSVTLAAIAQCYSVRGLNAVAAYNINSTVSSLFMIFCYSMGGAISIIVGQQLGSGNTEKAYEIDLKLMAFNFMLSLCTGSILMVFAKYIPEVYNTSTKVKELATFLLRIASFHLLIQALYYCSYFTLRTGGKTFLTFLFDSGYQTVITLPVAFILSRFTSLSMTGMYLCVVIADIPKVVLGLVLVLKGIWVNNLVADH